MTETVSKNRILIKIIDFGIAETFSPLSKLSGVMGTPYYIALELLMSDYNEKYGIWNCGVIIYILLSGTLTFN